MPSSGDEPPGDPPRLRNDLTFSLYLIWCRFLRGEKTSLRGLLRDSLHRVCLSLLQQTLQILRMDGTQFLIAVLLGLVPTAVAVVLQYRAIETIGSAYTAVFSTLEPVANGRPGRRGPGRKRRGPAMGGNGPHRGGDCHAQPGNGLEGAAPEREWSGRELRDDLHLRGRKRHEQGLEGGWVHPGGGIEPAGGAVPV